MQQLLHNKRCTKIEGGISVPPKQKVTKEMILTAALDITRRDGFEAVNARAIAAHLQCSTRPIFTCYASMEALKKEFFEYAFACYERYVEAYRRRECVKPYLVWPLSYLSFAREETALFRFIFAGEQQPDMEKADGFCSATGSGKEADEFSDALGIDRGRGKKIFLDLFLYTHGMAVLTAAGKLTLGRDEEEKMLSNFLLAFVEQDLRKAQTAMQRLLDDGLLTSGEGGAR